MFKNKIIIDSVGDIKTINNSIDDHNTIHTEQSTPIHKKNIINLKNPSLKTSGKALKLIKLDREADKFDEKHSAKSNDRNEDKFSAKSDKISVTSDKNDSHNLKSDSSSFKKEKYDAIYQVFHKHILMKREKADEDIFNLVEYFINCFEELKIVNANFKKIAESLRSIKENNDHSDPNFLRKENLKLREDNKKIKLEIDYLNKKSIKNESLTKKYIEKISSLEEIIKSKDEAIINLKNKSKIVIENMESINRELHNEMTKIKERVEKKESEVQILNEKEKKLMRIIYLVYKKGKNINDLLNSAGQAGITINNENLLKHQNSNLDNTVNDNDISTQTIYLTEGKPQTKKKLSKKIPTLDFKTLPEYDETPESNTNEENEVNNYSNKEEEENKPITRIINVADEEKLIVNRAGSEQIKPSEMPDDNPIQDSYEKFSHKNSVEIVRHHKRFDSSNSDKLAKIKDNFEFEKFPDQFSNSLFGKRQNKAKTLLKFQKANIPALNLNTMEKAKDFNEEFLENYQNFSESWRKEVGKIKRFRSQEVKYDTNVIIEEKME